MRLWLFTIALLITFISHSIQAEEGYDAFISKVDVAKKMLFGHSYDAKVTVTNTGAALWSGENEVSLALTSASNRRWNIDPLLIQPDEVIRPGDSKTFSFPLSILPKPGVYSMQFEMRQANNTFGQQSPVVNTVIETQGNRAALVSQLMPDTMNAGQKYSVVVQFRNEGSISWKRDDGYQLGLINGDKHWKLSSVRLVENDIVPSGSIATFRFDLIAPKKAGNYPIQWQMQRWNNNFGEITPVQRVNIIESVSQSGAEFIHQKVPGMRHTGGPFAIVKKGDIVPVSVTFKNTSDEVWAAGHYSLHSQNPANNLNWSIDHIELKSDETIKPGQIKTFNFNVMAPLKPGIYHFQWQMVKGFKAWAGEKSENVVITVK